MTPESTPPDERPNEQPPEQIVSWDEIVAACRRLADAARATGPFRGIVAIARGGLIPAALLARLLDVRLVDVLSISSHDGRVRGPARLLKSPRMAALDRGQGWLVVDDIADSGATCALARTILPRARFAALYARPEARAALDLFAAEAARDAWIVFPWEAAAPGT